MERLTCHRDAWKRAWARRGASASQSCPTRDEPARGFGGDARIIGG